MIQLRQPNLDPTIWYYNPDTRRMEILQDWLGWCLAYVEVAFDTDRTSDSAWDEWNRISHRHEDRNLPLGVYVPIWFSHWGTYNGVYKNWGHVAFYKDGHVWSSPISHKPYADEWNSIEEVEQKYRCSYVGWSEDIGNVKVIREDEMVQDTDNEYGRWRKAFYQIRGRDANRQEFNNAAVGRTWLNALEILSDDPEADSSTNNQEVGKVAVQDNWQGQIYDLQNKNTELGKAIIIKDNEIKKLTAQLAVQSNDTELLNGFGVWAVKIITRIGLKG